MRRAVSILLLSVFLFKLGGYDFVFWFVKRQILSEEKEKMWTLSNKGEIQNFAVPMPLPYMQPTKFESTGNFFEYNGEFLRIVDLYWEKDSLFLTYVKDHNLKDITDAIAEYHSIFEDHESSSPIKIPPAFLKEYQPFKASDFESKAGWTIPIGFSTTLESFIPTFDTIVEIPPPRFS